MAGAVVATKVANLSILPAGKDRKDVHEHLGTAVMGGVLNEARESSLDPNIAHTLRAEAEGFIPLERSNTLPNAGVWDVSLALRAVVPTTTASTPVYNRWWFWTIIGATAAGAAAAVLGFVLRPTAEPPGGNTGFSVQLLTGGGAL